MFSFFKRRKAKKEQELLEQQEQQRLEQGEQALDETVETGSEPEAAAPTLAPEPTPVADVTPAPELTVTPEPTSSRQALLETADLTPKEDIFVELTRDVQVETKLEEVELTPEPEPAPALAPEPAPEPESVPTPEPLPVAAPDVAPVIAEGSTTQEKPSKGSWLSRLRKGLSRTGQSLTTLFVGVKVDEELFEELETALIMADAGVEATEALLTDLRAQVRKEKITEGEQVKKALKEALTRHLSPLEKPFPLNAAKPLVLMIAGVNGAGKTTSIGKLAHTFQQQGASVLLAAGDTFRAAAREQLVEWGNRNNVQVIAQEGGNPGAVAFNAVTAGKSRGSDVVMVDTAGRLPTQLNLMEELKKVKRAITKADASSPHECLLVVDGNTGQNALAQIKAFDAAIGLTGLVVTKLDGTAKGGILAAVAAGSNGVRPIPVYWIGVGEGMHDLQPFVASEFAGALLGD